MDSNVKTRVIADDSEDKIHVVTTYDAEPVINQNKIERDSFSTYKDVQMRSGMVKIASLHPGDVERLANMGYNLLSPDKDEIRRAILYIQSEQTKLMTVTGKPFQKVTKKWQ